MSWHGWFVFGRCREHFSLPKLDSVTEVVLLCPARQCFFLYLKASRDSLQVILNPSLIYFDSNFCIKCNLIIFLFTKYYKDDQVKDGELGAKCNMQGGDENGHRILIGNSGGVRLHGRSLCRWDYNNKMRLTSGRQCERGNKPLGFTKSREKFISLTTVNFPGRTVLLHAIVILFHCGGF